MSLNNPNFRHTARQSLARARAELASNDPHRARYAALELRDSMEALTYDRALAYKEFIPPEAFKTWQPRKLMALLIEIDPTIGQTSTIAIGEEEEFGKASPPEKMEMLGTDTVLTLANLKSNYDALGSFLHMPSLEQVQKGKLPDPVKLRDRCETIATLLDRVFSSQVWNATFGNIATLDECMNDECKKPVRKRIPSGKDRIEAQCFECKAEYTITTLAEGRVYWTPKMIEAFCASEACREPKPLWQHQIAPGTDWVCGKCGLKSILVLGVAQAAGGSELSNTGDNISSNAK